MPLSTTLKLKSFLEIVFENPKLKFGENSIRISLTDFNKHAIIILGGDNKTLKNYEIMMKKFDIWEKKTQNTIYLNRKGYNEFIELFEKINNR